jgi:hypothetical protein
MHNIIEYGQKSEVITDLIQDIGIIVNTVFAFGVMKDTKKLRQQGKNIQFTYPIVWVIATILTGVFAVAAYWIVHHFHDSSSNESSPKDSSSK